MTRPDLLERVAVAAQLAAEIAAKDLGLDLVDFVLLLHAEGTPEAEQDSVLALSCGSPTEDVVANIIGAVLTAVTEGKFEPEVDPRMN